MSFCRNAKAPDGLHYYCRSCASDRKRAWYAQNLDKARADRRAYVAAHREEINAKARAKPRDPVRERQWKAKSYAKHRDRRAAYFQQYYEQHRDKLKAASEATRLRLQEELHDSYITKLLCADMRLRPTEIPPELIELKREQLRTHRLLADLKSAIQGDPK